MDKLYRIEDINLLTYSQFQTISLQLHNAVLIEDLTVNSEVPGSIPCATRFSEYQWVWNGVHSAPVRINEELLERKAAVPV
jgi:hypothetical protein